MKVFRHFTANDEYIERLPFKRELSMEAYLIENETILELDDTYNDVEIITEELALKHARPSNSTDGRIDLLVSYANEHICIVELKIGMLDEGHLAQLQEYLGGKDQILKGPILNEYPTLKADPKWIGVLVGSSISPKLAEKISGGEVTKDGVPIAALTIQRFRSKRGDVFITTDTYFKNKTASKDQSKYKFNKETFGKGRLVLAVIKKFAAANPQTTFAHLERNFPMHCQGAAGTFVTEENARTIAEKRPRHFLKPEDLIELSDVTIAVSNQWGLGNIDGFIERAISLGFDITKS